MSFFANKSIVAVDVAVAVAVAVDVDVAVALAVAVAVTMHVAIFFLLSPMLLSEHVRKPIGLPYLEFSI